jgi:hypothetical protein
MVSERKRPPLRNLLRDTCALLYSVGHRQLLNTKQRFTL